MLSNELLSLVLLSKNHMKIDVRLSVWQYRHKISHQSKFDFIATRSFRYNFGSNSLVCSNKCLELSHILFLRLTPMAPTLTGHIFPPISANNCDPSIFDCVRLSDCDYFKNLLSTGVMASAISHELSKLFCGHDGLGVLVKFARLFIQIFFCTIFRKSPEI